MLLEVQHVPSLVAGCLLRQCSGAKVVWLPASRVHESLSTAYLAVREASKQRAELLAVLVECQAVLDTIQDQHQLRRRLQAILRRIEHVAG